MTPAPDERPSATFDHDWFENDGSWLPYGYACAKCGTSVGSQSPNPPRKEGCPMSIWVEHENCGCGVEGAGTKYSHFKIRRCGSHAKTVDVSAILAKARAEERERWESALKRATAKAGTEVGCDSWRQGFRDGCAHVEIEFHKIRALVRGNKGEGELDEES